MIIKKYKLFSKIYLNSDSEFGSIDVDGDVDLSDKGITVAGTDLMMSLYDLDVTFNL